MIEMGIWGMFNAMRFYFDEEKKNVEVDPWGYFKDELDRLEVDPWGYFKDELDKLVVLLESNLNRDKSNRDKLNIILQSMSNRKSFAEIEMVPDLYIAILELNLSFLDRGIEEFRIICKRLFKEKYKTYLKVIKAKFVEIKFVYEIRVLHDDCCRRNKNELHAILCDICDAETPLGMLSKKLNETEFDLVREKIIRKGALFLKGRHKSIEVIKTAIIQKNEQLLDEFEYGLMHLIYNSTNCKKTYDEKLDIIFKNIADEKSELGIIARGLSINEIDSVISKSDTMLRIIFGKKYEIFTERIKIALIKVNDMRLSEEDILYLSKELVDLIDYLQSKQFDEGKNGSCNELLNDMLQEMKGKDTFLHAIVDKLDETSIDIILDTLKDTFERYFRGDSETIIKIIKTMLKDPIAYKMNQIVKRYIQNNRPALQIAKIQMCDIEPDDILNMDDIETIFRIDLKALAREAIK